MARPVMDTDLVILEGLDLAEFGKGSIEATFNLDVKTGEVSCLSVTLTPVTATWDVQFSVDDLLIFDPCAECGKREGHNSTPGGWICDFCLASRVVFQQEMKDFRARVHRTEANREEGTLWLEDASNSEIIQQELE